MNRTRTLTAVLAILAVLTVAGAVGLADVAHAAPDSGTTNSSNDSSGQQSAEKNEIMQIIVQDPGESSLEQRRKAVAWLLEPGNLDKLSEADRQAVRTWLSKAEEQGVTIPSRDAVERALDNAAASQPPSEQNQSKNYDKSCESDLSPALCITNETWTKDADGWEVTLTLKADYPHQVVVTDSGFIRPENEGKPIPQKKVTLSSGYTRVTMDVTKPDDKPPLVTVNGGGTLLPIYGPKGKIGLWGFISGQPTTGLLTYILVDGIIGSLIAGLGIVAYLRYRHRRQYRDVLRESYIRPATGIDLVHGPDDGTKLERAKVTASVHRRPLAVASIAGAYAVGISLGYTPSPQEVWAGLGNPGRALVAGSLIAVVPATPAMGLLIKRVWNPRTEYVLDLDARDVLSSALGEDADPIAVYEASPEVVAEMDITNGGKPVRAEGTDGTVHVVRRLDPETNEAEATWADEEDDRAILLARSKIEKNREYLEPESRLARRLLSLIPGIQHSAENAALRRLEKALRDQTTRGDGGDVDGAVRDAMADLDIGGVYDRPDDTRNALDEGLSDEGETEDTQPGE